MGLSKEAIEEFKETPRQALRNDVKVQLTYKSSPRADFRLYKALSMLLNEEDIFDYLQKCSGREEDMSKKEQCTH